MRSSVVAIAGLALLAAACGGGPSAPAPTEPAVTTAPVETRRVELTLPFLGWVEAAHAVRLVALTDGRVLRLSVADGARVAPGDSVLVLGGPQAEEHRAAMVAAAEGARRRAAAAAARLEQAQRRAAAHLAAPGEVAQAEQDAATAEASRAEAAAALARLEAALEVRAPVGGRLVNRVVSPGQDLAAGDPLAEILEPGSLRVAADVVPVAGREPVAGDHAEVVVAGGPLAATVSTVQPVAGAGGTVRVWLTGGDIASLAPGTAVRGRIVTAVHEHAVCVPEAAVVRDEDDRPLVFVGHAAPFSRREVTTGETGPGWVEVTSGLAAGEEVVTTGAYELYWASFATAYKVED